jgi:acyl-[acyl-carrier-protein]-phospholipid O-acyltransferase / long-chain-fatty-acid--[acyl-carrier-protein] ligase
LTDRFIRFIKAGEEMVSLVKVENTLEKFLPKGVSCCVVEVSDEKKGASIIATVTIAVNKTEILKKMGTELPMMSTGKIDFRTVTRIVQEIINGSGSNTVATVA